MPHSPLFWLRADSGITQSGNGISQWDDVSGIKRFASQQVLLNQPTLTDDGINHIPVVHFNGQSSYLNGPSLYPVQSDYTVSMVVRINNFGQTNSIFAGGTHEIYLNGGIYPIVMHGDYNSQAYSGISLTTEPAILTVVFRQSTSFATLFINGEFADSGYVGTNYDSSSYIGSIRSYSLLNGDIAELILYKRILSTDELSQLENYLSKKYAIPLIPKPLPPDSTFVLIPRQLQFYQRDEMDSAIISISGNIYTPGFDSIYTSVFKNNILLHYYSLPLHYTSGKAPFAFQPRIHAELSEYRIQVGIRSEFSDSVLAARDSIVCGDAILIDGQSNSINNNLKYTNEFYRTFGRNYSLSYGDTLWSVASTDVDFGGSTEVGSWGLRLQELIKNTYGIPTCIINGGVAGTIIEQHLPDPHLHDHHRSIYGSMLYRAEKSRLASTANVLFWYQGEWNTIADYFTHFSTLYHAWKEDYPNLKKIYVIQTRMGCSPGFSSDLRDLQRTMQDSFPDIESFATMGLRGHDGCHFDSAGYSLLGDQLFRMYAHDFHGSTDTLQIASPNIHTAYFTDSLRKRIILEFFPIQAELLIPKDTLINGFDENIRDYFYLNDTGEVIEAVTAVHNMIYLDLKKPSSALTISYLPDHGYKEDTSLVYEGPWIKNSRGLGAFSFYHFPIIDSTQHKEAVNSDAPSVLFEAYPNPSNGNFTLHCRYLGEKPPQISIIDVFGRVITKVNPQIIITGEEEIFHPIQLDVPDGFYFCRLKSGNISTVIKLSICH